MEATLQPLLDKSGKVVSTAEGTIEFSLHAEGVHQRGLGSRVKRFMSVTTAAQDLFESEGESLLDDQEQMNKVDERRRVRRDRCMAQFALSPSCRCRSRAVSLCVSYRSRVPCGFCSAARGDPSPRTSEDRDSSEFLGGHPFSQRAQSSGRK